MENNVDSSEQARPLDVNLENLVAEVRAELTEIDAMDVSDHAVRFEQLHTKLNSALSSIDGM
ncbi:MAG: hypothetical protein F2553_04895 [Actinobacteria bacterium]|uniref:Unannotated protein n=1 Tax=freshwater metagenome TaxID=449393 RepID=A0A6J6EIL8_9ZZZZ|nr:hypothetical protein [Actinomycetota bacterium]